MSAKKPVAMSAVLCVAMFLAGFILGQNVSTERPAQAQGVYTRGGVIPAQDTSIYTASTDGKKIYVWGLGEYKYVSDCGTHPLKFLGVFEAPAQTP
jgi:hypothetical protein